MDYIPSSLFVGAYATAPKLSQHPDGTVDRIPEAAFYSGLRNIPLIGGFEVPLLRGGVLHAQDEPWVLSQLFGPTVSSNPLKVVLTCVPATMVALDTDKHFGLASNVPTGRRAAVTLAQQARDAVSRINAAAGRQAVVAVEIQSAPCTLSGSSSPAEFISSLIEIGSWDWEGAELVVEHCDAAAPERIPAKGFLTLDDEISAVVAANAALRSRFPESTKIGISINWARSVLETRSAETPLAHIRAAGPLLRGLIFSGCSGAPADTGYGAWLDSHMPHEGSAGGSLLTFDAIRASVAAAAGVICFPLLFLGAKVTLQPAEATPESRAAVNAELLTAIASARAALQ